MVRSTIVVRASDALPLAASVDDEQVGRHLTNFMVTTDVCGVACVTAPHQTEQALQEHKQQAKLLFRRLTSNSEPRLSIESGPYTHQYVLQRHAPHDIEYSPVCCVR